METLLVIGSESVVGANLACTLADRFDVVALSCDTLVSLDGCANAICPRDDGQLARTIQDAAPAWVIHCGPLARSSWDETTSAQAARLSMEPRRASAVLAASQQVGCRLTVISTDAVFIGPRIFHGEAGITHGTGPMAEAALAVEQTLAGSAALVVRTHAYGWSPLEDEISYAEAYWQALDNGTWPQADSHRYATPVLASDLAELLAAAYAAGLQGLYHIAGAERTSPRRFAAELAAAFDVTPGPLRTIWNEVSPHPALETSLVCRRARQAIQQAMPMLREGLLRFAEQRENGHRDRLRGAEDHAPLRASAA